MPRFKQHLQFLHNLSLYIPATPRGRRSGAQLCTSGRVHNERGYFSLLICHTCKQHGALVNGNDGYFSRGYTDRLTSFDTALQSLTDILRRYQLILTADWRGVTRFTNMRRRSFAVNPSLYLAVIFSQFAPRSIIRSSNRIPICMQPQH